MANRMNRYKALAADLVRHDTASVTPRHVFLRAQNSNGSRVDRKGDR